MNDLAINIPRLKRDAKREKLRRNGIKKSNKSRFLKKTKAEEKRNRYKKNYLDELY